MRTGEYVSRRDSMSSWSRNRNTVRHTQKSLGSTSFTVLSLGLVLAIGLIYVAQGSRATAYDYDLARAEEEIAELQAQKEDLAVEQARLTSVVASETSSVAVAMTDATVSGYAEE